MSRLDTPSPKCTRGAFVRSMELELAFFEAPLGVIDGSRRAAGGVREPAAQRA